MIAEIGMGFTSLKAALDLAKSLNATATQATINEVKIGLQGHILEAQEALAAAREADSVSARRIGDLEQEIMRLKDWEAEKQRYQLKDVWNSSAFAYVLKPGMENGEPPHWLCATCFERRQKSILQSKGNQEKPGDRRGDYASWACNACRAEIRVSYKVKPSGD